MEGIFTTSVTKDTLDECPMVYKPMEEIIANIKANEKTIRYELGTRVRNQLRIIPELRFFVDDSLDYIEHIDELLKQ